MERARHIGQRQKGGAPPSKYRATTHPNMTIKEMAHRARQPAIRMTKKKSTFDPIFLSAVLRPILRGPKPQGKALPHVGWPDGLDQRKNRAYCSDCPIAKVGPSRQSCRCWKGYENDKEKRKSMACERVYLQMLRRSRTSINKQICKTNSRKSREANLLLLQDANSPTSSA